ncbi:MAG: response regulator [Cyclobacteriaceae bacterium]
MDNLYIVCVDDQRDVLSSLSGDLSPFEDLLMIEECESAREAWDVIESIDRSGDHLAIIITDQVMPEQSGVELLKQLIEDGRFLFTKKILLTGLATHQDTIEAINKTSLDRYIEKPWSSEELHTAIKSLLTGYLLDKGLDYEPYTKILDQQLLLNYLRKTT